MKHTRLSYLHSIIPFSLAGLLFLTPLVVFGAVELNLNGPLVPCGRGVQPACDFSGLIQLVENLIDWLLLVAVFIAGLMIAYSGFLLITAAGSEAQISKALGIFKSVIVGFIIALLAWLIIELITSVLLEDELSPLETANIFLSTEIV